MISMELGCKFLFNVGFHSKKSFRFVVALSGIVFACFLQGILSPWPPRYGSSRRRNDASLPYFCLLLERALEP